MTRQTQTDAYLEALTAWGQEVGDNVHIDVHTLATLVLINIGGEARPNRDVPTVLAELRERLNHLRQVEGLFEDFLITSVVNFTTELFEQQIRFHGDNLIRNERAIQWATKQGADMSVFAEGLNRQKDPAFIDTLLRALTTWQQIVLKTMGPLQRRAWENERAAAAVTEADLRWARTHPEVQELLGDIPHGKLYTKLSSPDLSRLTVEEARRIRAEIDAEENQ